MVRRILILFLGLLVGGVVSAQAIKDVTFRQEGEDVVITYQACADFDNVSLEISTDKGRLFRRITKGLSGDVGKSVAEGKRTIRYSPLEDIGEIRSDNVCFKVKGAPRVLKLKANNVAFELIIVKGGTFSMGATSEQGSEVEPDEKPVHKVTLSDYYIGKFEVTQALWQDVMGGNPSKFKASSKNPVDNVSWEDCQKFITKLNTICHQNGTLSSSMRFNLPTEAQWEYAARGGSKSKGYKYAGSSQITAVARCGTSSPAEVGTKAPNELGIYDMSGNVCEWCKDWYDAYPSASVRNPGGASIGSYHVLRGGSWSTKASVCRVSNRSRSSASSRDANIGLRLVCQ